MLQSCSDAVLRSEKDLGGSLHVHAHSRNALLFHRVKCFCDVMDKSQVFDLLWGLKILTTTLRIEEIAYPRAVLTFTSNNEDLF